MNTQVSKNIVKIRSVRVDYKSSLCRSGLSKIKGHIALIDRYSQIDSERLHDRFEV